MAGWKNSAGTGNRGQDAPGEKGLGGAEKAPKEMGRRTEKEKKKEKVEESSDLIWCFCCCYTEGPASRVYGGYLVTHTTGQEVSV